MGSIARRRFLEATVVAAGSAVAGCLGELGGGSDEGTDSADGLHLESLDVGGSPGDLVSLRPPGTVALLDFFATWCAPCKPEMANLRAVRKRYDPEVVSMVSITQETDRELVREFWIDYEGTWPVALDPDLKATRKYEVQNIPTIIVLTPDGEEVWRHVGLAGEESIAEAVERALPEGE